MKSGRTDDPYWNACQLEMVRTGYMHGYMRMYWGKKVIEWTADWRRAWALLIEWNDRYEIDGRDPNGYAGVAWCFGMHDRPWKEREVFGVIRYMNANGLKRKFDIEAYVRNVREQTAQ
jgi:deoxyribodipyrimidine photo-lyase